MGSCQEAKVDKRRGNVPPIPEQDNLEFSMNKRNTRLARLALPLVLLGSLLSSCASVPWIVHAHYDSGYAVSKEVEADSKDEALDWIKAAYKAATSFCAWKKKGGTPSH